MCNFEKPVSGKIIPENFQSLFGKWMQLVQDVINQPEEFVILPWVNWMRLKQTNLIDHPKLRICMGDQTWMEQWFPWFPLLSGFGFEQNEGWELANDYREMKGLNAIWWMG